MGTRLWLLLLLALVACKDKGKADSAEAATTAKEGSDPAAAQAAKDLLAKRDSLMKSRQKLQEERDKLEAQRLEIIERGEDTTEIDKQLQAKETEVAQLDSQHDEVETEMQSAMASVQAAGEATALVAARESSVNNREERLGAREERIAAREAALAKREAALAEREKNTCSGMGGGTTIITTVDPKAKYTKRDVEKSLKAARDLMSKKGILRSDLPAQAAGLEKEATKAMADGDNGPAKFAAAQLFETVKAMNVDRGFIGAKMARLNKAVAKKTLDESKRKEVEELLVEATALYGDGNYAGANKKLNAIYRAID
jgi:hypothetical protein